MEKNQELTQEGMNVAMTLEFLRTHPEEIEKNPNAKLLWDKAQELAGGGDISLEEGAPSTEKKTENKDSISFIRENFGIEDPEAFKNTYSELERKANVATQLEQQILNLPIELREAIQAASKGEDWTKPVKGITFSKEDHSDRDLVEYYFPGQFTKEELSDIKNSEDPILKKAIGISKANFQSERQRWSDTQNAEKINRERSIQQINTSLDKAVDKFKKSNPKASPAQIERLKTELANGTVQSLFFKGNEISEDAITNLWALRYPFEYRQSIGAQRQEDANKQIGDILSRGADKKQLFNSGAPDKQQSNGQKEANFILNTFGNKQDAYSRHGKQIKK